MQTTDDFRATVNHARGCSCANCAANDVGDKSAAHSGINAATGAPIEQGSTDTVADNLSTTATVSVGGSVSGVINSDGDTDWYRITLQAGKTYVFNLDGGGSSPLADSFLRLYDNTGDQLRSDDDSGAGRNAQITFTANRTGTYYLSAESYVDDSGVGGVGDYTLRAAQAGSRTDTYSVGEIAAFLTHGYWGGDSIPFADPVITYNVSGLSADAQTAARAALRAWSDVAAVTFVASTSASADIVFDNWGSGAYTEHNDDGTTFINISSYWNFGDFSIGDYGYQTFVHEIGHALGLGHAGNYNGSATYGVDNHYANDSWSYSIMSYFTPDEAATGSFGFVTTAMLADIAAVQSLYGAATTREGSSTYGFNTNAGAAYRFATFELAPLFTIYDSGGVDTIDASRYSDNQSISLVSGGFSSIGGSSRNIAITASTVIENAKGGYGNDRVTGNAASNVLTGNAGNDRLQARDGDDTLYGSAGEDNLAGHSGNDRLIGGRGRDVMSGGSGDDVFKFTSKHDSNATTGGDVVVDFAVNLDTIDLASIDASTRADGDQAFSFIKTASFHNKAGELHYKLENKPGTANDRTIIEADLDGDGAADLQITLNGLNRLDADDFVL